MLQNEADDLPSFYFLILSILCMRRNLFANVVIILLIYIVALEKSSVKIVRYFLHKPHVILVSKQFAIGILFIFVHNNAHMTHKYLYLI